MAAAMLALSDFQIDQIFAAARPLRVDDRE
jgi:hypothetical protein